MRKFILLTLPLISSAAHADMRAVYGLNGRPALIVDARDESTMRISYPNEFTYSIIDMKLSSTSIFEIYKKDNILKISTLFGRIQLKEKIKFEIYRKCGFMVKSRIISPILNKITYSGVKNLGKFKGFSFDLEIDNNNKIEKHIYIQYKNEETSYISKILYKFEILKFLHATKFQTIDLSENSLILAYKTIYDKGIPLIWPKTNLQLMSISRFESKPNHYLLPEAQIESDADVKEIEAGVMAALDQAGVKCER